MITHTAEGKDEKDFDSKFAVLQCYNVVLGNIFIFFRCNGKERDSNSTAEDLNSCFHERQIKKSCWLKLSFQCIKENILLQKILSKWTTYVALDWKKKLNK